MSDFQAPGGSPWDSEPRPEPQDSPPPFGGGQGAYPGGAGGGQGGPGGYQQYPPGGYGQPGPGYGQPGYGQPGFGPVGLGAPGYPSQTTNGMSIAALVCGICGFLCGIPAILAICFGFAGLSQIKRTGQRGRGMAIAGIIVAVAWLALIVLDIVANGTFSIGSSPDS
jgi:Domain of unknown function (DUF4190)